ncbi:MAG: YcjX family protein [Pseudomonadota bacterium]
MVISTIADGLGRGAESVSDTFSAVFMEPVIRLGVTGLSRAGKTVFITSLVSNLIDRARMPGLVAAREGRITAAFLQPQPSDLLPRFEYERHLNALIARDPYWPDSTRSISELRLSLRVQPNGLLSAVQGPRTIHIDIVDYPGEWLLDLSLLDKSYKDWSVSVLQTMETHDIGAKYQALVSEADGAQDLHEPAAQNLAESYTDYLDIARKAGFYNCTPGRFLLPGDLAGSPALTFAPLTPLDKPPRRSLWREMERRYEAYKARIVKPFFREHFARIDRQIVLVDVLGAIHKGPQAVADMRQGMADILSAFRPGQNAFLSKVFLGRRVEKILFAATKADHLHHSQHGRLTGLVEALLKDARSLAQFKGAETKALSVAALRTTTEETRKHDGVDIDCVRGTLLNADGSRGKQAALYPGALPDEPSQLLAEAAVGAKNWLDADYEVMNFAPASLSLAANEGPPHIRLDQAAEFLIGDRL